MIDDWSRLVVVVIDYKVVPNVFRLDRALLIIIVVMSNRLQYI